MEKNYGIKELTLYKRDFRDYIGSITESFFDDVLSTLDIPEADWDNIHEITLKVDSATWDGD